MKRTLAGPLAVITTICALMLLLSCGSSDDGSADSIAVPYKNGATDTSNAVAYWNKVASDTINLAPSATGTAEEQRPIIQVDLATVHVAI